MCHGLQAQTAGQKQMKGRFWLQPPQLSQMSFPDSSVSQRFQEDRNRGGYCRALRAKPLLRYWFAWGLLSREIHCARGQISHPLKQGSSERESPARRGRLPIHNTGKRTRPSLCISHKWHRVHFQLYILSFAQLHMGFLLGLSAAHSVHPRVSPPPVP